MIRQTQKREKQLWKYSSPEPHGLTNYLGVIGPDCAFSGSVPRELSEVTDDLGATIILVDVNCEQAVHWMSPHDASKEVMLEYGPESKTNHPGIILAAFLDGHVVSIYLDMDQDILRAMLTIAGGETISDEL